MATSATALPGSATGLPTDRSFSDALDRWIYVFMAASFVVYTLVGFVPDSIAKVAAVGAGQRPPFPMVLHAHAILMGAFLLLLLVQAVLAANGRLQYHRALGVAGGVLGFALVVVGLLLVPTMYQQVWGMAQSAPAGIRPAIEEGLRQFDNVMLLQIRVGVLFPILLAIALLARGTDPGLHKRMMFLAVAVALPAAFDRMTWLPSSMPDSAWSLELWPLLAIAPMFAWDFARTRKVHRAYVLWVLLCIPASLVMHSLWNTEWWHAMAPRIAGV